jgi:hypothetical protein
LYFHPPRQALAVDAKPLELFNRHDTVLIRRKASDMGSIGEFLTHVRE